MASSINIYISVGTTGTIKAIKNLPAEFIETDQPERSSAASPLMSLPSCVCAKAKEINKKSDSVLV
jgi:hypothetical protein